MFNFSQQLTERLISYWGNRHGVCLTAEQAEVYLLELASLYRTFGVNGAEFECPASLAEHLGRTPNGAFRAPQGPERAFGEGSAVVTLDLPNT